MKTGAHWSVAAGIRPCDIQEVFVRASGPGGQHVNKTATCVCVRHIPTGIEVRCQQERSQHANRVIARELLARKVHAHALAQAHAQRHARERARRAAARRRPHGAQERVLESKRRRANAKKLRQKVNEYE
jgi:protein subunit release factor B